MPLMFFNDNIAFLNNIFASKSSKPQRIKILSFQLAIKIGLYVIIWSHKLLVIVDSINSQCGEAVGN